MPDPLERDDSPQGAPRAEGRGAALELKLGIERLGVVPSTNEFALARPETAHGTLFLAAGQTAGRGTRGRRWINAEGRDVAASLVLVPPRPLVSPAPLSVAAGLAVHAACRSLGIATRLDWPNDVIARDAKLAGILVERRGDGPFVVGIGWNVEARAFPEHLVAERAVTSLALEGADASRQDAEAALAAALAEWMPRAWEAPESLLAPYLAAAGLALGAPVRAKGPRDLTREGPLLDFTFTTGAHVGAAPPVPLEHLSYLERRP